eukprot:TRINITY_DN74333_c0_g1_i1.p1 TRINITY_DN74333_c0_g1~~TRINITY_DN74333_c0_g1_i1.p1  ORF type:complete len:456 (-),score=39.26 TRINITY_DN74333_c0_g1_i1:73-1377(-)
MALTLAEISILSTVMLGLLVFPTTQFLMHPSGKARGLTGSSLDGSVVLVGSGGCDGQDTKCKDVKSEETVISIFSSGTDGSLQKQYDLRDLPGLPAWFAVRLSEADEKETCVFVTYPDSSSIDVFQWKQHYGRTELKRVHTVELDDKSANPVHADVSSAGNVLIVANYHGPDDQTNSTGASVQSFGISPSCALTVSDIKYHSGSSTSSPHYKDRQSAAHPHSAVVGRNNLVFVCDLGMDTIFTYSVDADGNLTERSRVAVEPGSGPRHSVLHPTLPYLFVVNEISSTVVSYRIGQNGDLTLASSASSLPDTDPKGAYGSKAAEIAITPDGLHLYASNRAFAPPSKDSIAVFDVSPDGQLTLTQQMLECPAFPRGMALLPDGSLLFVASQTTSEVVSFKVDAKTGHLTPTGSHEKGPLGAASFGFLTLEQGERFV